MIFKHINNYGPDLDEYNNYVNNNKHAFVLIFMDGCGPCGETIPKWNNIETLIGEKYKHPNYDNVMVASINKDLLDNVSNIGSIEGFPTMKYISKNGAIIEPYEESPIVTKDRSTSSFIEWIENKLGNHYSEIPQKSRIAVARGINKKMNTRKKYTKSLRNNHKYKKQSKQSKQKKQMTKRQRTKI